MFGKLAKSSVSMFVWDKLRIFILGKSLRRWKFLICRCCRWSSYRL